MNRIDFSGVMMALLTGFILSAGITGFLMSANGIQFPIPAPRAGIMAAPGIAAPAVQVQTQAQAAPGAALAPVEIKVQATDLKFGPPTLQAKVGQPVKIVLENKGAIEHDIAFPTLKANKPAADLKAVARTGQTATLEFTPTAKGVYEYVCTIPGHKEAGMKGTINVTD
ncbi:MAG: cupredoxin domain-containing protein [Chloroflexi bacterium]|nr:cupredoxin domain-containing protein [Chloroflexota bacterium]